MEDERSPERLAIARRRAVAIAIAAGAVALAIVVWPGGDGGEDRAPSSGVSAEAAGMVAAMSGDQLADQVMLVGFEGDDPSAPIVDELGSRSYGGVLVASANWNGPAAGTDLVAALRAAGRSGSAMPPLLVAAQEGGRYRELAGLPPERSELAVGESGSAAAAAAWARQGAAALRAAGFDLDLFPIADIATLDSPLAGRAFSDDPSTVARMTVAAVRGCGRAGLACAAAHFPGLGAASEDTDAGPATVGLDPATLEQRDAAVFADAFAAGMPAVVLSLAYYVAYDPVTPAALSPAVVDDLLRRRLGFRGVAITDDLGAGAVRSNSSVRDAAVAALAAGADLVRIDSPADQRGVHAAIVEAMADGSLPEERLREAAGRVIELKRVRGLLGG